MYTIYVTKKIQFFPLSNLCYISTVEIGRWVPQFQMKPSASIVYPEDGSRMLLRNVASTTPHSRTLLILLVCAVRDSKLCSEILFAFMLSVPDRLTVGLSVCLTVLLNIY